MRTYITKRREFSESVEDLEAASSHSSSRSQIDLAEWINEADKTEVPVYIVFSILLVRFKNYLINLETFIFIH